MIIVLWLFLTYGVTLIITGSRVSEPLRKAVLRIPKFGYMIGCPMCFGWWAGLGLSILEVGPAHGSPLPVWLVPIADAFCSSAWCWVMHVILAKLGAEEL